jgi:DnaK suppressor protein
MIAVNDRFVGDSVDAALDDEQDEVNSQLAMVESRELAAIDAALQRISDGRCGICDVCNQPISMARLQALPFATLCINCQRDEEHSGRNRAPFAHWERAPHQQEDELNRSTGLEFELA